MYYLLADNQDITRIGLEALCLRMLDAQVKYVSNKAELLQLLPRLDKVTVILDYSLFDFDDVNALSLVHQRFPLVHWIIFSDELSSDFVRRIVAEGGSFSIVSKNSEIGEIEEAIRLAMRHERYLCRLTTEQLLSNTAAGSPAHHSLTKTEVEILREIALGKTTKEIAAERFSSFHTVNTHRKNIFRKLDVTTAYEATKYALRAGLIDASDYYI